MIILQALYFAFPIYFANTAPVLVKRVPFLSGPIDGGKTFRGKPLLGKNKTWRGFFSAILFGFLSIFLMRYLQESSAFFADLSLIDYTQVEAFYLGTLMGLGAIVGDAAKSFFKRRLGKPSGSAWPPFDQLDLLVGGLAFGAIIYWPGWQIALILFILTPIGHIFTNRLGYRLHFKEVPW